MHSTAFPHLRETFKSTASISHFILETLSKISHQQDLIHLNSRMQRLLRTMKPSSSIIFVSLNYFRRFVLSYNGEINIWRVYLAAYMAAEIYLSDCPFSCKSYSMVTEFSRKELVEMKRSFLKTIHFDLVCPEEEYANWVNLLEHTCERRSPVEREESMDSRVPTLLVC